MRSGGSYNVTVNEQPSGQVCTVQNGIGSNLSANVSNVQLVCSSAASAVSLGGTVTGLASGTTLQLINNNDAGRAVTVSGSSSPVSFTFAQKIASGSGYLVKLAAQPSGHYCSVSRNFGVGVTANISNVNVQCTAIGNTTFTVGGTVSGLTGTLTLVNNADPASSLRITANGGFTFGIPLVTGSNYEVTMASQPAGQVCSLGNSSGAVGTANVGTVTVVCASSTAAGSSFSVGGNINGVASGDRLTLRNGADLLTVTASASPTAFTMGQRVPVNGSYALTVAGSPIGKMCTVTRSTGAGVRANVTNVAILCSNTTPPTGVNVITGKTTVTVGGSISGLVGLVGQVVLVNNNDIGSTLTLTANGSFTFPTPVASGGTYAVTVLAQPSSGVCTVFNPSTKPVFANVTNVSVICSAFSYTVGGTVAGLASGGQITLVNNGDTSKPVTVTANGTFTFAQPVARDAGYRVTVLTQQSDNSQICAVAAGVGLSIGANVTAVAVNCTSTVPAPGSQASNPLKFEVTYNFGGLPDGSTPMDYAPITGSDGNVYGMTQAGGANGVGTVYRLTPTGVYSTIYTFQNTGAERCFVGFPNARRAPFIEAKDGYFYGVCSVGGTNDWGGVYRFSPTTLAFTLLASFDRNTGWGAARHSLVQGLDGNFYGVNPYAGAFDAGRIYKVTMTSASTATVSTVYDFIATGVGYFGLPAGNLTVGSDGALYGLTQPDNRSAPPFPPGPSYLYRISAEGVFSVIPQTLLFSNDYQRFPSMTLGDDGSLYGSTNSGGINSKGIFFKLTPAGVVSKLGDLPDVDPGNSMMCSSLTLASDGNFYGTLPGIVVSPTVSTAGLVFQLTPSGTYSVIYDFGIASPGQPQGPGGGVTQGSDGYLYGATSGRFDRTSGGGTNGGGTLYKLLP